MSESTATEPMTICSVVTKSHLALARVLARSVKAVHPSAQVYVLLADRVDGYFDPAAEPFITVQLQDLGRQEFVERMSFYYTPLEFCCALHGLLHVYMWERTTSPAWIYLDSDIYVLSSMSEVMKALRSASVLLNPHNSSPASPEFVADTEVANLRDGLFNGGFLGVRRCEQSRPFVSWFTDRLGQFCFDGVRGLFVDQLWLNHVPQYFRDVTIFTQPGANLAHWNLYKRTLTRDAQGRYLADGQPLMFVHFSGWNIEDPDAVSRHVTTYQNLQIPQLNIWRELAQRYRAALLENGYATVCQWPYAFSKFDDGTEITWTMRRSYYQEICTGRAPPTSPFARGQEFRKQSEGQAS
ncbi:MAG: glycosyl transferase, group 1 [Tepidisphaeraceae bacterium]